MNVLLQKGRSEKVDNSEIYKRSEIQERNEIDARWNIVKEMDASYSDRERDCDSDIHEMKDMNKDTNQTN